MPPFQAAGRRSGSSSFGIRRTPVAPSSAFPARHHRCRADHRPRWGPWQCEAYAVEAEIWLDER